MFDFYEVRKVVTEVVTNEAERPVRAVMHHYSNDIELIDENSPNVAITVTVEDFAPPTIRYTGVDVDSDNCMIYAKLLEVARLVATAVIKVLS